MNEHQTHACRRGIIAGQATCAAIGGLFLALGLLGGCTQNTSPADTATSPTPVAEVPAGSFVAHWRQDLPLQNTQLQSLSLNANTVFAFTADNQCYWVNRASGRAQNLIRTAAAVDSTFDQVTLKDYIVFPSTKQLAVFDHEGRPMYNVPLRYSAASAAAGSGRAIFLGVNHPNGGRLAAISTKEQPYELSPAWDLMTRGQVSARPVAFELQVFAGSQDGRVYAVRAADRMLLWPDLNTGSFATSGPILADLKADKSGVYVASTDTKLYCLNLDTGRINWVFHAGHPLRENSSPVLTADTVYLAVPGVGLAAINKVGQSDLRQARWIVPDGQQFLAASEQLIYVRDTQNRILAVDKQTGDVKFRSTRTDFSIFATNESATDSTIYAATPNGQLYAIKAITRPGAVGELVLAN